MKKGIRYITRDDLNIFYEGEFESIFVELDLKNGDKIIIGSIYRVPETCEKKIQYKVCSITEKD